MARWGLGLLLSFLACATLGLVYLKFFTPLTTAVQLQRRVEALLSGRPTSQRYTFVPRDRIAGHLGHAVIAAEDGRFFQHHGIDWREVQKAADDNRRRGRLWRGGSTITQQLVKNLFLTTHLAFVRKPIEVPLALLAELILSKQRILELYLNVVEWGPSIFGAEAAAQYHYRVPAARLTREQAAHLAACLPAPRRRRPTSVERYAGQILGRMDQLGW